MTAKRIEEYFDRLWPINRSITGPGFRESLAILEEIVSFERFKFHTGQKVFDWIVPYEWHARDAYFISPNGQKYACFKENNLHLMGYSTPINQKMSLEELSKHIHTIPEMPDAIPYVTSYYKENWGFCISHNDFKNLIEGEYKVFIDSELYSGNLEIGEAVIHGESKEEILFSTYLCHPSMANNELSGPLVMAFLYEKLKAMSSKRYTYRFVIMPETIGAICYLSMRGEHLKNNLIAGYVMSCLGDPGNFTYKLSRRGDSLADRAAKIVLRDKGPHSIVPFNPRGSDERQYCSPGFNLPVGVLTRSMFNKAFPQYHTSFDNKDAISFNSLCESVELYYSIINTIESNYIWKNTVMYCEPQLGRRLAEYPSISILGGDQINDYWEMYDTMLWLLNLADGTNDLIEIAEISGQKIEYLIENAIKLSDVSLIAL